MKKFLFLVMILLPSLLSASEPVKAFGSVYFGMTKKEVNNVIRSNRTGHVFKVGEWEFKAVGNHSKYTAPNKGLSMLKLISSPVPLSQWLTKQATEALLNDLKRTFMEAGYTLQHEHTYFPNPLLLVGQRPALLLSNEEKGQHVFISVPRKESSAYTADTYVVNIDIMWAEVAEEGMIEKEQDIQESIQEVDDLF